MGQAQTGILEPAQKSYGYEIWFVKKSLSGGKGSQEGILQKYSGS